MIIMLVNDGVVQILMTCWQICLMYKLMFFLFIFQEHDEPILKHLLDIRVVFTGPDSNVDTTQYPQPTPMVCL